MNLYRIKLDWSLIGIVALLITIGFMMIISTSSVVGFSSYNDSFFFIKRHFMFLVIGIFAATLGAIIPIKVYQKYLVFGLLMCALLLILTLTTGVSIGGARRWLNMGLVQFQPVECVKFCLVVFIAHILDRKKKSLSIFSKSSLPILVIVSCFFMMIILQPDLGNIGLIAIVMMCLLFLSAVPLWHLIAIGIAGISGLTVVILKHSYQMKRVLSFLSPWEDPLGINYHMIQSLIAIGIGGFMGVGIGESKLKYFYLPLQYSDFIFSIICEEGGFVLAAVVIILYAALLVKGYQVSKQSDTYYGFYLGMGVTLLIVLQAFINIAVVIGLMPVTGIPLTFISFGGSSLVMSMFYIGILLNIHSEHWKKQYDLTTHKKQ